MSTFKTYVFLSLFAVVALGAAQAQSDNHALEQGNRFFALGQYQLALTQYQIAASAATEQQPIAQFNIGVCQHRLGRWPEAVRAYREALRLTNGHYAKASHALGLALLDLDNGREARQAFAQAVEVSNGRDAGALFQLALLLAREGDGDAAMKRLQQAIKEAGKHADKRFPGGHNNLGVLLAMRGRMEDALREFELALQQSNGQMREAADNLKLCRALLKASKRTLLASLKTTNQTQ